MLLPRRIIRRAKLREMIQSKPKDLRTLVYSIRTVDRYFLDDENAIVVMNNPNKASKDRYITIHYRLEEGKLIEVNRWYQKSYLLGSHAQDVIKDLNLFMVQGGQSLGVNLGKCHHAIYHYKLDRFIVKEGQFDGIGATNQVAGINDHVNGPNYLREYGCFLAYFSINSTYEKGDIITYENPVTKEMISHDFNKQEFYFALVNPDGTIRGNNLFQGINFSRIDEIVELGNCTSLEEFKKERIDFLTRKKQWEKEQYIQKQSTTSDESIFPHLDKEVWKVLTLTKKGELERK